MQYVGNYLRKLEYVIGPLDCDQADLLVQLDQVGTIVIGLVSPIQLAFWPLWSLQWVTRPLVGVSLVKTLIHSIGSSMDATILRHILSQPLQPFTMVMFAKWCNQIKSIKFKLLSIPNNRISQFDISFPFIHFESMVYGYSVLGALIVVFRVFVWKLQTAIKYIEDLDLFYLGGKLANNPLVRRKALSVI